MAGGLRIERPIRVRPAQYERWRKLAIVAVSLGLHTLVLGYVALKSFTPPRQYIDGTHGDPLFPAPTIYLQVEPRPLLRGETARTRETPPPEAIVQAIPDAGTRLTEITGATGSADVGDRRLQPMPRGAADTPVLPADAETLSWRVRPAAPGDGIGRGLRASRLGCTAPDLLSASERDICDERFARRASLAKSLGPPPDRDRDEAFARQADANEAWRAYTRDEGPYPGLRSLFTTR
jgi:hypothetical protein